MGSSGPQTGSAQSTPPPFKRFWSSFWACQLRFFRQLVVSLKVPELTKRAEAALAEGDQVVITFWGTGESQLACMVDADDGAPPSCPEIMLDQFLTRHFPCPPEGHVRTLALTGREMAAVVGVTPEHLPECLQGDLPPHAAMALREKARLAWNLPAHGPLE